MSASESPRVCVLDYGSGNVRSVFNLLSSLCETIVSNEPTAITNATHVVLPGVGAFGAAMRRIKELIPLDVLEQEVFESKKPFLGICVGMQVLADRGQEFGTHRGLGWISGSVERLEVGDLPLPHVGWNDLRIGTPDPLLEGLGSAPDFYYVHSYALRPTERSTVLATTDFGEPFTAAVRRGNIWGVQFHPEKSQKAGKRLARNFLQLGTQL